MSLIEDKLSEAWEEIGQRALEWWGSSWDPKKTKPLKRAIEKFTRMQNRETKRKERAAK